MIQKDKELDALFADFRPKLSDSDAFMSRLEQRMQAVDLLKEMQRSRRRVHRIALLCTFVLGIVSCLVLQWLDVFSVPTVSLLASVVSADNLQMLSKALSVVMLCGIAMVFAMVTVALVNKYVDAQQSHLEERMRHLV